MSFALKRWLGWSLFTMLLVGLSSGVWVIGHHENLDTKARQELTDTLESKSPLLNEAVTANIEQISLRKKAQASQRGLTLVTRRLLKPILLIMIALLLAGGAIRAVHEHRLLFKKEIAIAMPTPQILIPQMPLKRLRRTAPAPALVLWTSEARAEEITKAFEAASQIIDDPKKIVNQLTRAVADISNGPTLFFTYHAKIQAAVLESDAGFAPQENAPFAMAFPIHKEALALIVQSARERKLASLATYPPLSKVLLDRIGIAHFEAWALTTVAQTNDPKKIPALLGILVILQAGVQSTEQRPSIVKTMRAASLAYERASRPQKPTLGTRAAGIQAPPRGAQRLSPPV